MNKIKQFILKVLTKSLIAGVSFFAVTFVVYFFNLDMKLTAAMEPIMMKIYDKIPRNTHL